jgi:hypothetical protein
MGLVVVRLEALERLLDDCPWSAASYAGGGSNGVALESASGRRPGAPHYLVHERGRGFEFGHDPRQENLRRPGTLQPLPSDALGLDEGAE